MPSDLPISDLRPPASGILPDVQRAVADRLMSFREFGGLLILTQCDGDIESRIASALAPLGAEGFRPGAALLVAAATADIGGVTPASLRLDPVSVTVTAAENTLANAGDAGTGRPAQEWAVLAARALLLWHPRGCTGPLRPPKSGRAIVTQSAGHTVTCTLALETGALLPLLLPEGGPGNATLQ